MIDIQGLAALTDDRFTDSIARRTSVDKSLRVSVPQGLLMIDLGLHHLLGVTPLRTMRLTDADLDEILRKVPRVGRVAVNLRIKVAALRWYEEISAALSNTSTVEVLGTNGPKSSEGK